MEFGILGSGKYCSSDLACAMMRSAGITFSTPFEDELLSVVGSKIGGSPAAEKSPTRSASVGTVAYSSTGVRAPRAREREKHRILAAWLGQPRDVRRADECEPESVRARSRLLLRLTVQTERLRVQRRVAPHPEDGPVRLAGIESAKIPAPRQVPHAAAAKSSAKAAGSEPTSKTTAGSPATEQPSARPPPPLKPPCARIVSIASRNRSISTPASGLTEPDCPLIATD